jgi:membrane fusion protein, heavy metal efflux system
MTPRGSIALFLFLSCASALGCNARATPVTPEEKSRDFIHLDPASPRLAYIKVEVADETDVAPNVQLTGRVTFDEDHTQRVASPIDGRVTKILVQLGDNVKDGQSLVELVSAQAASMQAEAQKAEQDLSVAEKALERAKKLRVEGAISDKEAAQVEADYKKATAEAERGSAQLRSLNLAASGPTVSASLRARISGTVVERNILVGQEVRADAVAPLLTISDLHTVWVLADLYEQDLSLVGPGAAILVRVPAYPNETFAGKVDHVGEVLDPMTHTVKLRCVVPNPEARLKPEMFARIELATTGQHKAIILPSRAILTDSQHTRVIVASEGNVFRQRTVETGPEVDGKVRVLGGIKPGEKVVTDGAIFLKREMESD